jgi:hypothetical protein
MMSEEPHSHDIPGALRSPIRPQRPIGETDPDDGTQPVVTGPAAGLPENPQDALNVLRDKMERVAQAFSNGEINRAQFNAVYGRYLEQRTIIERLQDRAPASDAWQHAARPGHTGFLLDHFQARPLYFMIYRIGATQPLMVGGAITPDMDAVIPVLRALEDLGHRPRTGLARKSMGNGKWMVLALGHYAFTLVVFRLEPSLAQINRVRDLHHDFERANHAALARDTRSLERMVFPQRALVE